MKWRLALALPWCCVVTFVLIIFSAGGIMSASWGERIDGLIHLLIPLSIGFHLFMGWHLYHRQRHVCQHGSNERKLFWASVTILVLTTLWHLTPWHDMLLGHTH